MKRKNFILTTLIFLFISILGLAVENPNPATQESVIAVFDPDFVEGVKEYKPNLENIDKMFNYIEKNIKQKGRAIFYGKLDQEKKELIVTDENNKIIYTEKFPEKLANSIPYFEIKQTYSLKNGKTLNYSETNLETFGKRIKIKTETLSKNRINKKDAIEVLSLMSDINKVAQNGYSKIEYSNMETFDENDNLILTMKYKNKKMVIEQEIEGDKVKMITYFDNLNTMNGKMVYSSKIHYDRIRAGGFGSAVFNEYSMRMIIGSSYDPGMGVDVPYHYLFGWNKVKYKPKRLNTFHYYKDASRWDHNNTSNAL